MVQWLPLYVLWQIANGEVDQIGSLATKLRDLCAVS
jgi:hypothetical protein